MSHSSFVYFKLQLKLLTEQLGTATEASIYHAHVLQKSKKLIKEANNQAAKLGKITKNLKKYVGDEISPEKEASELRGIISRYQEMAGRKDPLPNDVEGLLEYAKEIEEEFNRMVEEGEQNKATIFMKDTEEKERWIARMEKLGIGIPFIPSDVKISTHMILGNIKENLKIITNNTTLKKEEKPVSSKVQIGEMMALDFKGVEEFTFPSEDIMRDKDGKPDILERPITFDQKGKKVSAIAQSQRLPAGTEYFMHIRVRAHSPLLADDCKLLHQMLDLGKNNGIGQWRGSGGKGSYVYKLDAIDYDPTLTPKGGWQ